MFAWLNRRDVGPVTLRPQGGFSLVVVWLQPRSGYDPTIEQIDAAFGVLCETRIVRDHANR
jgi:hypothetical protein